MAKADAEKVGSWWLGQMNNKSFCVKNEQCNKVWPEGGDVMFQCTPTAAAAGGDDKKAAAGAKENAACDVKAADSGCAEGLCCMRATTGQKVGEDDITDEWLEKNTKGLCLKEDLTTFKHPTAGDMNVACGASALAATAVAALAMAANL